MARKKVETNISFDEMRQKYYVCMDYGLDETGKRVKKYKTYPTLAQARRGLRDFQTAFRAQGHSVRAHRDSMVSWVSSLDCTDSLLQHAGKALAIEDIIT